jgi:xylulokinase
MISIGTSGTVLAATESVSPDPTGRLHFFNSVLPGQSYYMGCMLSAGSSLNWFRETMGRDLTWDDIGQAVEEIPPGAEGMLWLPYLNGERTPHRNPNARGVLYGLSSMSDRRHVFRAVMEGITFGLRDSFELVRAATPVKRIIMAGGGARSAAWRRMTSSVIGCPVSLPESDEGGAYGAAMLAALGCGIPEEQVKGWPKIRETMNPNPLDREAYDRGYVQFRALYRDLRERFDATAETVNV